jgi:hypothetical protein
LLTRVTSLAALVVHWDFRLKPKLHGLPVGAA